jgi:hypothetical protein
MMLAMGSLTAGAYAAPNPGPGSDGPQSANVPYVAWVGEHVRLVVCDRTIGSSEIQFANYQVEDWSGYQFQVPTPDGDSGNSLGQIFDPGPAAFFESSEPAHVVGEETHEGCVATDYKSLNPGLARIRVDIRNEETGAVVFSHQFLVIWLTVNQPTLSEAGLTSKGSETFQSQLNGTGQGNLAHFLGDPEGNGEFAPSPFDPGTAPNEAKGLIQIRVTGSFPVVKETPLSNILTSPSYTLPEDWAELAGILASSSEETEPPGTNPGLWDIHGTPSNGNTSNSSSSSALFDSFSRPAFGDETSGETATVGPYDPQAANETLLSDGSLNADDAPMPALRLDVKIAKNEGGSDLGGVGQISGASKAMIYSHDFTGNPGAPGNLYNPYYGEYIPSTDRPVNEASGIDGPSPGGDFPGFLNKHPEPYTFWNPVLSSEPRSSHPTGCLHIVPGKRSTEATPENDYFTPEGDLSETFYTDERGEAYVTYTPGDGFYFERLGLTTDANNGCDLESLYKKELGHSSITAKAVYPYEPVDYQPVTSEPLLKTVKSLWLKEVYEFPKGTSEADQNVRIIVAKAQDIDGNPFVGEEVCFNATADSGITAFTGHVTDTEGLLGSAGAVVYLSGSSVVDPTDEGSNHLCETTNSQGLAAIEVTNSTESKVDVTTHYINEGITRDKLFDFSTNAGSKEAQKAKEAKEAEEKKQREEKAAEEKVRHEKEEAAEKTKDEKEEAREKAKHEKEAAEEVAKNEKEAAAEKARHEKEVAEKKTTEEKEAAEKKFHEEEGAEKVRREEKAAEEKRKREEMAAEEKAKREERAAAEKVRREEEAAAASKAAIASGTQPLVTPLPGSLGSGGKGHKAHAAKHKAKKTKKTKKRKKK